MTLRSLLVWWDQGLVGVLSLDADGDLSFSYDRNWIDDPSCPPISQSLPKGGGPFNRHHTRPFFAGLLPEDAQREAVAQNLGISKANDFRLLEALGGDVAGALTLWPHGEPPPKAQGLAQAQPLKDAELIEILDILPGRPMLAGREGLRLSLAGAQQKLPVVLVDGRVALPQVGQPTTHILKPPIERFAATTENEAFSMRLAAAVGLLVAPVEPRRIADRTFLLIQRYDRVTLTDGSVQRLHQEDFCQALGIAPEKKYASEGGPGFKHCFDLVRRACSAPAPALLRLLDAAIFNTILGNADAHGKNFSLLYTGRVVDIAPLYDLLCTAAYPELSPNLAMGIAKRSKLGEFKPGTWESFAQDVGVGAPYTRRRVRALAQAMASQAPGLAKGLGECNLNAGALSSFSDIVCERAAFFLQD